MADIWRGQRVRLRGLEPEDWEAHFAWDQDSDTARMLYRATFPPSAAHARRWAEETARQTGEGDAYHFAVESLEDGELVGDIATHTCDRRVGSFFYGVATVPARRRRGYASEAILLVARYYFHELGYQKMNAHVYSNNPESIALHEHLGFTREGTLRRMAYTGGRHYDVVAFGMTAEEFATRHPEWAANNS